MTKAPNKKARKAERQRKDRHPEPAPEGRKRPHHDDRDFNPCEQREYRACDPNEIDPKQVERHAAS